MGDNSRGLRSRNHWGEGSMCHRGEDDAKDFEEMSLG